MHTLWSTCLTVSHSILMPSLDPGKECQGPGPVALRGDIRVHHRNSGQSLPLAPIAAICFICSSVISGGPGLKVILWIMPVNRKGTW